MPELTPEKLTDAEIVRTLAERVMGWKEIPRKSSGPGTRDMIEFRRPDACNIWYWPNRRESDHAWDPLTSISDAFMVVEKMRELGFWWRGEVENSGNYSRFMEFPGLQDRCGKAHESNLSRAICLAAIAALEGK